MRLRSKHSGSTPRLAVQIRLLIYITAVVFLLAGLEMIILAFSSNPQSATSAAANGLQPRSQAAALATVAPSSLSEATAQLPNSKEEAANFTKQHQSQFDFDQNATVLKKAGYNLKTNLKLVQPGMGLDTQTFSPALKAAISSQQQQLQQLQPNGATSATPDAYEPDNSPQQASLINVTISPDLSGTQAHTFTDVNDVDWAYFIVRKPGVNYAIFTNATAASGIDTKLDLYDSNLNLIASNDDAPVLVGNNPHNSTINFVPPDTGGPATYYVRVRDVAADGSAGPYYLTIFQNSANLTATPIPTFTPASTTTSLTTAPACSDAYDPSDKPGNAKLLNPSLTSLAAFGTSGLPTVDSTNDGTQAHIMCPAGEVDWVYMDLVAGKPYSIFTSALRGGLDTFEVLYTVDSSGNIKPLYSSDDFPNAGLASRIDWVVPTTSTTPLGTFVRYYLAVKDVASHGNPGLTYNLTLATVGSPLGDCNDFYQPDYNPTQAKDIQINESQVHTFCPAGNSHWVRFFAKASRNYVMQTSFPNGRATTGLDTSLVIYSVQFDPKNPGSVLSTTPLNNQRVLTNSDPSDLSSTVSFGVPSDGYYYVQVRNAGDIGQPGYTYRLTFAVTAGSGSDFGATQTAIATQTASSQSGGLTATAISINNNRTATAVALTVFAVNGTQTAVGLTATAQGTPNPSQQTATALVTPNPSQQTATAIAALTPGPTKTPTTGAVAQPLKLNNAYFADISFSNIWSRVDKAIVDGVANRSWEYGPKPGPQKLEAYAEANGGTRQVQYFSKSRMEINNLKADRNAAWFVTNGLLVKEMISGAIAMGDNKFVPLSAPQIPIAGDLSGTNNAPYYASFGKLITINDSNRASDQTGQPISQSLNRAGVVSNLVAPPAVVTQQTYIPETGHNIPDKFWAYLNSKGQVFQNEQYSDAQLMDWVFVMGLPISEPYWTKATVGGIERDVLVQVFERRVLTYTPSNEEGWQVEMGNVGEHYYLWRYGLSMYANENGN